MDEASNNPSTENSSHYTFVKFADIPDSHSKLLPNSECNIQCIGFIEYINNSIMLSSAHRFKNLDVDKTRKTSYHVQYSYADKTCLSSSRSSDTPIELLFSTEKIPSKERYVHIYGYLKGGNGADNNDVSIRVKIWKYLPPFRASQLEQYLEKVNKLVSKS